MSADRISQIKERAEKATKGPWLDQVQLPAGMSPTHEELERT